MRQDKITFLVLFLLNISGWTSVAIFGPLIIDIASTFTSEISVLGITHSVFLLFSGGMSFIWAILEHKYSRKLLLGVTIGILSCGLLLVSISPTLIAFFVFRMITAVGFGALLPLSNSILMDVSPSKKTASSFSFLGLSVFIGFGAGVMLPGILLGSLSWQYIICILALVNGIGILVIFCCKFPQKAIAYTNSGQELQYEGLHYSFQLRRSNLINLIKIRSNLFFILFFFIHDFVVGTISFYFISLLRSDLGFSPYTAMLINIGIFFPQLFGAPLWGKIADKKFIHYKNGKVLTLLLIIVLGPIFSISAYLLVNINAIIFIVCLLVFALITPSTISIAYSVLGDVNPPELHATAFSLSNFSTLCGRSIGIAVCGMLYSYYFHNYNIIFLIWQVIFMVGLTLSLITLRSIVPVEMDNIAILCKNRQDEGKDNIKIKDVKVKKEISIKDMLTVVLNNQKELAEKQSKLAESQYYITKLLYYSLEVMRRIFIAKNHTKEESPEFKHSTEIESKIIEYLKSKVN